MKKISTLIAILVVVTFSAQAKIWRVNNNTGITADFNNLNAAVNASNVLAGDTIQLEASVNGYGGASVSKRVVILGTGYFLSETSPMVANPKTQANVNAAVTGSIDFYPGSKGSIISGVYISGSVSMQDSFITQQRCVMTGYQYLSAGSNTYGDTIRNCFINAFYAANNVQAHGWLIYNNIIYYAFMDLGQNINNIDGYFINNSFIYDGTFNVTCANFTFQNNIFKDINFGSYQSSNIFFNNVCHSGVPAGNSNVLNASMSSVYLDYNGNGAGYSSDGRFKLAAGSPAIGAGVLNSVAVDCGAFGGPAPYTLSGMPSEPSIYSLTVPAQVSSGTPSINITLSSASH